jgi:hypothetical protein
MKKDALAIAPRIRPPRVPHRTRGEVAPSRPLHLILHVRRPVWELRNRRCYRELDRALAAGCRRFGFRLNHYYIKARRIHLIVEVENRLALFRGMQGLTVRIARGLNRAMDRCGTVFADRYQLRTLDTPAAVRAALNFVLFDFDTPRASLPLFDPYRSTLGPLVRSKSWLTCVAPP